MAKPKTVTPPKPARGDSRPEAQPAREKKTEHSLHPVRETIEQIVFAFVLAFLFRTFEAEAFVIPTGSMAPTLQGRHKDVECPKCNFLYRAGASSEVETEDGLHREPMTPAALRKKQITKVTCPMCRYSMDVDPDTAEGKKNLAYNGDRIIVAKFPYDFRDPSRWDVVVFKFPGDAKTNYIKRLVGLPGETLRISGGDISIKSQGSSEFAIARKEPWKTRAMLQLVYDNAYIVDTMTERGWPLRWQAWREPAKSAWTMHEGGRTFSADAGDNKDHWIRYQHFPPSEYDWEQLDRGRLPSDYEVPPQLITDFYAYNCFSTRTRAADTAAVGLHWVGDLMVEADIKVKSDAGAVLFDLVEGGKHLRATIDVATGGAQLSIDGLPGYAPKAQTKLRGPGSYKVALANVDDQLVLWIDGKVAPFDAPTAYTPVGMDLPQSTPIDAGDLAPAGVGARGVKLDVTGLRLYRDIYYIADTYLPYNEPLITDYDEDSRLKNARPEDIIKFMSSPERWASMKTHGSNARRSFEFPLKADQFFVLGDNSPASKDARLWDPKEQYVARELLTGKAVFIYWPHSLGKIPGTSIPFPFFPNFKAMGFVR